MPSRRYPRLYARRFPAARCAAAALAGLAAGSRAVTAQPEVVCAPAVIRYDEDCRPARGQAPPTDWRRLRYLPLAADGRLWLTVGGEYRSRFESLDRPAFDIGPVAGYRTFDQRFLVDADLRHASGARLFVEFSAATSAGRDVVAGFDRSAPDIQQLFVDLPLGRPWAIVRLGRQEFDGEGSRLFALRDATNLRRAFDMAQLDVRPGSYRVRVFVGQPVTNRTGAFDDVRNRSETFAGATARRAWRVDSASGTIGLFAVVRNRALAAYEDATGRDHRWTAGTRASAASGPWQGTATAALQGGTSAAGTIHAAGGSGDLFWAHTLGHAPVRLGATFGVASGDGTRGDGRLNTFDVLYPNLGYFTDAPVSYPGNSWDVAPTVVVAPARWLSVEALVDVITRLTKADAAYQSARPLVFGDGRGGNGIETLWSLKTNVVATPNASVLGAVVRGSPRAVLARAGARPFTYTTLVLSLRY